MLRPKKEQETGVKSMGVGVGMGFQPLCPTQTPYFRVQSNLYITVTLGKWSGDRYIQGDRYIRVSFELYLKLLNSFLCGSTVITQFTFYVTITINRNVINTRKRPLKCP